MIESDLRDYQVNLIDAIASAAAEGKRRLLAVLPTGSGKSVVLARIIQHATSNGKKVLVCVHRRELLDQMQEHLKRWGVEAGLMIAGYPWDNSLRVNIAMVQTLHSWTVRRKKESHPIADLVIFDETHHAISAKTWQDIAALYPFAYILGVTATPISKSGNGSGNHFDAIVTGPSISELVEQGHLVKARYFTPTVPDLQGLKVRAGDYVEEELSERMDKPKLIGDICENWSRICPTRKTLVFATSVKHSIHIAEGFRAIGIKAEHLDGETPVVERFNIVERFKNGDVQVLSNCMLFSEGFDAPEAACLIFARPTKSLLLYLQVSGRILRPSPGKQDAILIDHSGVVAEHGFLTQDFDWKLEYGKGGINENQKRTKKARDRKTITCGSCKCVYERRLTCPECGWKPTVRGKPVETMEAYLCEIDALEKPPGTEDRRVWWRGFVWYAWTKNHNPGSAAHRYKEKFGNWPPGPWRGDQPAEPPIDVKSWIRHREIVYSKSKARQAA